MAQHIDPVVMVEPRDFRVRPHAAVTHAVCGQDGNFKLTCEFVEFSWGDFRETCTFYHPYPPFSRLFAMQAGEALVELDGESFVLTAGRMYFLPAGQAFEATYKAGTRIKGFHLHLCDGVGFPLADHFRGVPMLDNAALFNSIAAAAESGDVVLTQAAVFPALLCFCRPFFPLLNRRANPAILLRRALEAVAATPPGELRIGGLAEALRATRAALSKSFQRQFGVSLKRHVLSSAIEKAKGLLLETDLTVKEISGRLGYAEASYFHAFFRKHLGATPAEYRERYRGGGF